MVANPGIVGRDPIKLDASKIDFMFSKDAADKFLHRFIVDVDVNPLALRKMPDDPAHDVGHRLEFAGPARLLVRPGKPGRLVRRPLWWHSETKRSRGCSSFVA